MITEHFSLLGPVLYRMNPLKISELNIFEPIRLKGGIHGEHKKYYILWGSALLSALKDITLSSSVFRGSYNRHKYWEKAQ